MEKSRWLRRALTGIRRPKPMRLSEVRLSWESLEARLPLAADVIISEFSASNDEGIRDDDGDSSDWIELLNVGTSPAQLQGWHLTDDPADLDKWSLPALSLAPGDTLLVYASGKDRDNPLRPLHTNFQLNNAGEFLALVDSTEQVVDAYDPAYPPQVTDVSYGIPLQVHRTTVVGSGAFAWMHVPRDGSLDYRPLESSERDGTWLDPLLAPAAPAWQPVNLGVGYYDRASDPNPQPGDGTLVGDAAAEFGPLQNRNGWRYGYWNRSADPDGSYDFAADFTAFVWSGTVNVTQFNHWNGTKWDLSLDDALATELSAHGGKPSGGTNATAVHDVIRRWTSDVSGTVLISGELGGTGVVPGMIASIRVDGQVVYEGSIGATARPYQILVPVTTGARVDFLLHADASFETPGSEGRFTARIEDVTQQVGPGGPVPTLAGLITTDIEDELQQIGSSVYLHIPFTPSDVQFDSLTLNVQYDDAFVAYLNGQRIAWSGIDTPDQAAWNTRAAEDRSVAETLQSISFDATSARSLLVAGRTNVLQIHGFNSSPDDDDFLIAAELIGTSLEIDRDSRRYFVTPTPDAPNGLGDPSIGPLVLSHAHAPESPTTTDPIVITAELTRTFQDVAQVDLVYRVMYGNEQVVAMNDRGTGGDATAGDGIYTARLPAGLAQSGQMLRWYFRARDTMQQTTRWPRFDDPLDAEQYFGTVLLNEPIDSNLPVFHWFVESRNAAMTSSGTRGSLYYDGEFYDNVRFDLHGQSSAGFPTSKKSMNVDFPRDHRFRWDEDLPRMKDIKLLTNFADKSKLRNTLAYEQRRLIGDAYHLAFPVRVHHNGDFFAVYDFVEDGDDRWLERLGLDPDGALYKMYNNLALATGEKKTRRDEGTADLQALVNGVQLSGAARDRFLMDNVDLASMANYLAGFVITSNRDCCHKNYYAYRDTNGSGEWRFLPWDVDLSQGRNWGGFGLAYFDDTMYPDNPLFMGTNNRLISALYDLPGFEEMYLRRVRSLMDLYVKPPGTPADELPLEARVDELVELMREDARLDNQLHRATWGQTGFQTFEQATTILKEQYAGPRREFLYFTQTVPDTSGRVTLVPGTVGEAPLRYFVPQNNQLGQRWTGVDFDDASWPSGFNGVGFEQSPPGYRDLIATDLGASMADRTSVYLRIPFDVPTGENISQMTLRMKYDDGFIAYLNGQEIARRNVGGGAAQYDMDASNHPDSEAVVFEDIDVSAFAQFLRPTGNVLAIQGVNQSPSSSDLLIVAELIEGQPVTAQGRIPLAQTGHPRIDFGQIDFNPVSGLQDEEYIELKNPHAFAVDLSGWRIEGGVQQTLRPGTVLPAGWSLYLTPNAAAFRARPSGPSGGQGLFVQGDYDGHLSNFGETLQILADDGTVVNSVTLTGAPTVAQQFLRVSEIMYHPLAPSAAERNVSANFTSQDFEYVELLNVSPTQTVDLQGVRFSEGISFDFSTSSISSLGPGQRLLIVRNEAAFAVRYGATLASQIAGEFALASGLGNDGETIKLEDATGSTITEFTFDDDADRGWSQRADGQGSSLEWDQTTADQDRGSAWLPSARVHGTPGSATSAAPVRVVINELLANTGAGQSQVVELLNVGAQAVELADLYLTLPVENQDALTTLPLAPPAATARLTPETRIVVRDEELALPLSGSLHLLYRDATDRMFFLDTARYTATNIGQTWGRVPDGAAYGFALLSDRVGSPNALPAIGPVVISELHYHPADPPANALAIDPGLTSDDLEFIELTNTGTSAVTFGGWQIRGDVDFDFEPADSLAPATTWLILSFDPLRPENAARLAAFRATYEIPNGVRLLGGYRGQLNNQAERVSLLAPIGGVTSLERRVVDEVHFADAAPWPESADGAGNSLHRSSRERAGDDPAAWSSAAPTPGVNAFSSEQPDDFTGDGVWDVADIRAFCGAWRRNDTDPRWDLNGDGTLTAPDRDWLINQILDTTYGDANLDGRFDSSDLIQVFAAGQYEDAIAGNSDWSTGDWNCDGEFDTSDLVVAFAAGGYELAARVAAQPAAAAAAVVDEPAGGDSPPAGHERAVDYVLADTAPLAWTSDDSVAADLVPGPMVAESRRSSIIAGSIVGWEHEPDRDKPWQRR